MKNKWIIWVVIVVFLCVIGVVGFHFYLLVSGRGVQIHIGNFNIIRLGSPEAFFPAKFEPSYKPLVKGAPNIRVPRYERNTTYVSELPPDSQGWVGDFKAKDIDTGKVDIYSWTEDTHYLCLSPGDYQVPGLGKPVDPVQGLKNYVFMNSGNTIGGIGGADFFDVAYNMFKRDVDVGTPVKFMLVNDTPKGDGGYNILTAIVFTKHQTCATPKDAIPDLKAK